VKNIANSTTRSLFSILVNLKSQRSAKAEVARMAGALDPEPRTNPFKTTPGHGLLALSALTVAALILPVCADAQGPFYGLLAASEVPQETPAHFYLYYLDANLFVPPFNLIQYDAIQRTSTTLTGTSGVGRPVAYGPGSSPYRLTAHPMIFGNNGANEVFYLAPPWGTPGPGCGAGGCDIEQIGNDGSGAIDLTINAVGPFLHAAANSSLVGFADPCSTVSNGANIYGSDNVFYVGTNQHVNLLTISSAAWYWDSLDVTAKASAPAVTSNSGVLTGHIKSPNTQWQSEEVFYIGPYGSGNHVYELWRWSGCPGEQASDGWHSADLNLTGGTPPKPDSPLAGFFDPIANSDAVFYVGTDNQIHEFYFSPQAVWSNIPLTQEVQGGFSFPDGSTLAGRGATRHFGLA
jgi:hypothetical protein